MCGGFCRRSVRVEVDAHSLSLAGYRDPTNLRELPDPFDIKDRSKILDRTVGAGILNTSKYPNATMEVTQDSADTVEGRLTLHGATNLIKCSKRMVIPVDEQKRAVGEPFISMLCPVVQTQYGITPYSAFKGALSVTDVVEVEMRVPAKYAAPLRHPFKNGGGRPLRYKNMFCFYVY